MRYPTNGLKRNTAVAKYYELWDFTSGNLAGEWATVEEVIDAVARAYAKAGMEMTDDYGLLEVEGDESSLYTEGEELVRLVNDRMHTLSK
jgi:hypothetical protein